MAKLAVSTVVPVPYGVDEGGFRIFGPDDGEVPDWAAKLIGAHCFEGGEHPLAAEESGESTDGPPPKAGRGSSTEAWAAYAEANGVAVDDGRSRDEIIAGLEKLGVPTE